MGQVGRKKTTGRDWGGIVGRRKEKGSLPGSVIPAAESRRETPRKNARVGERGRRPIGPTLKGKRKERKSEKGSGLECPEGRRDHTVKDVSKRSRKK